MRIGFRSNVWAVYFQSILKFGTAGQIFRSLNLLTQFFKGYYEQCTTPRIHTHLLGMRNFVQTNAYSRFCFFKEISKANVKMPCSLSA